MCGVEIDLEQLPIPDWGLICPECRYPLVGLPSHRCPECGTDLDVPSLVQPWTRLRPTRFDGTERPLPDFGLLCPGCRAPLAGAADSTCGVCGAPFDIESWRPQGKWFVLDREVCRDLPIPGVQAMLAGEYLPHVPIHEKTLGEIYGGQSMTVTRLRVPTEFYFETRWLVQRALRDLEHVRTAGLAEWTCPGCNEPNPGNFEVCWNCGAPPAEVHSPPQP